MPIAVVLSGRCPVCRRCRQRAIAIAAQFTGAAERVASVINVAGGQQVALKVMVAEVSRETVRQFGINLNANIGGGLVDIAGLQPQLGGASGVSGAPDTISAGFGVGSDFSLSMPTCARLNARARCARWPNRP